MDRRLLFIVLFAFTTIKCEDTLKNATDANSNKVSAQTEGNETTEINAPESPEPKSPGICQVCSCTKAGNILNCDDKNLTAIFTNSQWNVQVISVASFKKNLIEHVTPFPKRTVNRLILQRNKITKIDNAAFKQLINLTELDLSYNELTSESLNPKVFEGKFSQEAYEPLENLTILTVAYNKIHSFHQDLFEHMWNLKVLNMSHNMFAQIDVSTSIAISSIQRLEELDLSYCGLKQIPDTLFHTTRYLKKLNLSGNRLMIPPSALGDAIALEYLYMDENPMKFINNSHPFPNMTKLKELSFCCMPHLTTIGYGGFLGLDSLETLRIQNCPKLEVIQDSALCYQTESNPNELTWPPLKELILSDNALQYLPQYLLLRWDHLEKLDLMNNKWSCDCNNQYLIGVVLPNYGKKLMGDNVDALNCTMPPEHAGKNLSSLSHRHLRCLDLNGARPEKDTAILIGVLIGVLFAIPVCLAIFLLWRRGFFFCNPTGPASFSRAFYKRASATEDI